MADTEPLSLDALERRTGVPARQIRELIRVGVLPGASSGGRGATYGPAHVLRLGAWKRLRAEAPAATTTEQLRILIDRLDDAGLLRGIVDGSIAFSLVDDGREEVAVRKAPRESARMRVREAASPYLPPQDAARDSLLQSMPAAELVCPPDAAPVVAEAPRASFEDGEPRVSFDDEAPARDEAGRNEEALAYLRGVASAPRAEAPRRARRQDAASRAAARVAVEPSTMRTTLEVDLGAARRPRAGLALERLRAALDDYVTAHAAGVRVNPAKSETWQRVLVGRDLEIAARGPLDPDDVLLLETVARLLQQAIYRRSE